MLLELLATCCVRGDLDVLTSIGISIHPDASAENRKSVSQLYGCICYARLDWPRTIVNTFCVQDVTAEDEQHVAVAWVYIYASLD